MLVVVVVVVVTTAVNGVIFVDTRVDKPWTILNSPLWDTIHRHSVVAVYLNDLFIFFGRYTFVALLALLVKYIVALGASI